jgi:glycosyltransferase involved in cell wall biosynthesis
MASLKILYVAFEYPPLGGGGVQRSLYFSKYLKQNGIDPVVITTDEESFSRTVSNPIDRSLLDDVPEDIHVIRIPTTGNLLEEQANRTLRILARRLTRPAPDGVSNAWSKHVNERISSIIAEHNPAAILVSVPFFSLAGMWARIAKEYNIPLILDMRDAWSQWCIAPYFSVLHYWQLLLHERSIIKQAALVITTSDQTRTDLINAHPSLDKDRLVCITNGYAKRKKFFARLCVPPGGKIRIGYVGNFYYNPDARKLVLSRFWERRPHQVFQFKPHREDWLYRSPYFFFRALQRAFMADPVLRERVSIDFAGVTPAWLKEQVLEFGLTENCNFHGYLSRNDANELENACDILLITSAKVLNGRDYSIAGKTFEYFERGKPILSFVCQGAQKDMLDHSGCAIICDPDDLDGSASRLLTIVTEGVDLEPNDGFLQSLSRERLSCKLAAILKLKLQA